MAINVCSENEWHGVHGSQVTLIAPAGSSVTLEQDGPWPFKPSNNPPLSIPSGGITVTLVDTPGTYTYCASGCSKDEDRILTNPKTVIIS